MPNKHPNPSPVPVGTWFDYLPILDSHGVMLGCSDKHQRTPEAADVRHIVEVWIKEQGLRSGLPYVMPLRVLSDVICVRHRHLIALPTGGVSWAVVVDAINDPHGGLSVVRRPFRTSRAA